ncbi:hypothetical protein HanPI659440_Chr01g0003081 [Helianthus annuus]|nr:hypothetical protein HanPI659440_Chr01g0003081 [Helianthus annuus]
MGQKEARKRSRIRTPNGLKKKAQVIPERKQTTTKVSFLAYEMLLVCTIINNIFVHVEIVYL